MNYMKYLGGAALAGLLLLPASTFARDRLNCSRAIIKWSGLAPGPRST